MYQRGRCPWRKHGVKHRWSNSGSAANRNAETPEDWHVDRCKDRDRGRDRRGRSRRCLGAGGRKEVDEPVTRGRSRRALADSFVALPQLGARLTLSGALYNGECLKPLTPSWSRTKTVCSKN